MTTPVNLAALQDLCNALTSATMEDGEDSMSVADFLKVLIPLPLCSCL